MQIRSPQRHRRYFLRASVFSLCFAAVWSVEAATYTWDPTMVPVVPLGGSGTWNLTTANWSTGLTDVVWTDTTGTSDIATLGGLAGTVTLNTSLGALGLVYNIEGYTLSGTGTITLGSNGISDTALVIGTTTINNAIAIGGAQTWQASSGHTLAIGGNLSGTSLITQNGAGTVQLSGTNSGFSGGFKASNGTLTAASADALGTGTVTISGGSLQTSVSNANSGSIAMTSGSLTINSGGTLSLASGGGFTMSGGTWNINLASLGSVTGAGTGNFAVTAGTFALTNVSQGSFDLLAGFDVTGNTLGSAGNFTFTGLSAGQSASLSTTNGVLKLTVVPEPATVALATVSLLFLLVASKLDVLRARTLCLDQANARPRDLIR